ncbi:MAG: hypothetical protein GY926_14835 [bacterium]|nr:hypothetical protein [bacterium]
MGSADRRDDCVEGTGSTGDLGDAIRQRREELFGPKPGTTRRPTIEVPSRILGSARDGESVVDELTMAKRYEMELDAHRDTTAQLLMAKDALIARLEEAVRDRDHTIGQLRARLLGAGRVDDPRSADS